MPNRLIELPLIHQRAGRLQLLFSHALYGNSLLVLQFCLKRFQLILLIGIGWTFFTIDFFEFCQRFGSGIKIALANVRLKFAGNLGPEL